MRNITLNYKIFNIIKNELKIKNLSIKDGINKTRKWDSVANLNILLQIESKLKVKFNAREFNSLKDLKSILTNVRTKIKKQNK